MHFQDLGEGGERHCPRDPSLHVVVPPVEATKEVEDERTIRDRLAEVTEGVRHALHLAAVLGDGKVTLDEDSESGVEVESTSLAVAKELVLNGKPGLASGATALADDVLQLDGDGSEDLGEDNTVHPVPRGHRQVPDVGEDVVV